MVIFYLIAHKLTTIDDTVWLEILQQVVDGVEVKNCKRGVAKWRTWQSWNKSQIDWKLLKKIRFLNHFAYNSHLIPFSTWSRNQIEANEMEENWKTQNSSIENDNYAGWCDMEYLRIGSGRYLTIESGGEKKTFVLFIWVFEL